MQQRTKRIFAVVLFLDLVGFTEFSEKNDPEIIDDYLSFFFDFCSKEIKKNNGWVEKYIGDAICAVFYSSLSAVNDSLNACNCAFNILKKVNQFKNENKFPFSVRIGIDAGIVTTTKRDQYDVFVGQAINSASRIQSISQPNFCYVSKSIVNKAENLFKFTKVGDFELKGLSEKVEVFSLDSKKNIQTINKIEGFYFPRKEEIKIIEYYSDKNKIKLAIKGPHGSGKTYLVFKLSEFFCDLHDCTSVYICLNEWEKTNDDLIQRLNYALDTENILSNKEKKKILLIIDNFNYLNSQLESLIFINNLSDKYSIIITYFTDELYSDNLMEPLAKFGFYTEEVQKLKFEEFDNFLQNYFEKPVSVSFEMNLYKLTDGYLGRAINLLSLLKDEFSLTFDQIIQLDFDKIFSQKSDLLEHCYRINDIEDKMQILLSILAFSNQALTYEEIKDIYNRMDEEISENYFNKAKERKWINLSNDFYSISNEYLKQFIINSTSKQLKKSILTILFEISDNIIDKISYLFSLLEEGLSVSIDEEKLLAYCIGKLEKESLENKIILLKKLLKKLDFTFFYKIVKFILLDRLILPYLFNALQKVEIEIINNNYQDISFIKEIKELLPILFPDQSIKIKNALIDNFEKYDNFYTSFLKFLIVPRLYQDNLIKYNDLIDSIKFKSNINKDYFILYNFPFIDIDIDLQLERITKIFNEDEKFYEKFDEIYLNPLFLMLNKIQIFFILIENISAYIYFKRQPINAINKMLKLCEKLVLELNIPLLIEFYYGLFFYVQFLSSNFQCYGLHSKMEFKFLPELKEINEIIYNLVSFSLEHKEELIKENPFLKKSIQNSFNLFSNPPYYIPISISYWYYYLVCSENNNEIQEFKNNFSKRINKQKEKIIINFGRNIQLKNFTKVVLFFIQ